MSRIPDDFIQSLRESVDIVSFIQARVPLKKMGTNYGACCPFHDEKTPSFTVSPTKQFFHCFGCGAHGDAIAFICRYENLTFVEGVEKVAAQVGMTVPLVGSTQDTPEAKERAKLYELNELAAQFFQKHLERPEALAARRYCHARGLKKETMARFRLGFAPDSWDMLLSGAQRKGWSFEQLKRAGLVIENDKGRRYDRFRGRLVFPIEDARGRILGFGGRVLDDTLPKYLNSPETPVFHKSQALYGLPHTLKARGVTEIVIVEGYLDVLSLAQAGINGAMATLGTALTAQHLKRLLQFQLPVHFCFDGDKAGLKAAWRALEVCLPLMTAGVEIRFALLSEGTDPDALVQQKGAAAFKAVLAGALSFSDFFFNHLKEQVAGLDNVDGRAKLVALAKPYLDKMPQGIYRQMMFEALTDMTRLSKPTSGRAQPYATSTRPARRTTPPKALSMLQKIALLLVTSPEIRHNLTAPIWAQCFTLPAPVGEIAKGLESGTLTPEVAREQLSLPSEADAWLKLFPDAGAIQAEWDALMLRWQQNSAKSAVDVLLEKAKKTGLSLEEKATLKRLLAGQE